MNANVTLLRRIEAPLPGVQNRDDATPELRLIRTKEVKRLNEPLVAILLCVFEGEKFLADQLESIANQSHKNWRLYISEDGDCPGSRALISRFKSQYEEGRVVFLSGPNLGFAANFLSLVQRADSSADYYAFADQDDIWESEKISTAVKWLQSVTKDSPALYSSRTLLVDKNNKPIGFSPAFSKQPSFANALVQTIGGANTMVFNKGSRDLLVLTKYPADVVSHDWWTYLLVAGCGGNIFYDPIPQIRYRQHDKNLVGSNASLKGKLNRIKMLWRGDFATRNEINLKALHSIKSILTPENQYVLEIFAIARTANLIKRILLLKRSGIYRQTLLGNLGLVVAAIFKKI